MLMHALLSLSIGICASLHAMDKPELATSKELWQLKWAKSDFLPATLSPLGDKLISFHDNELYVHNAQNGAIICALNKAKELGYNDERSWAYGFTDSWQKPAWSSNGSYFFIDSKLDSHSEKEIYRIWNTLSGQIVKEIDKSAFKSLLFLNDDQILYQSQNMPIISADSLTTGQELYQIYEPNSQPSSVKLVPKNNIVYINYNSDERNRYTKFYNSLTGTELKKVDYKVGGATAQGWYFSYPDFRIRNPADEIVLPIDSMGYEFFNETSARVLQLNILESAIGKKNVTCIVDIASKTVHKSVENAFEEKKEMGNKKQFPDKDLTHWITTLCNMQTQTTEITCSQVDDGAPKWQFEFDGLIDNVKSTIFKNYVVASLRDNLEEDVDLANGQYLIDTTNGNNIKINTPFFIQNDDYNYNHLPVTFVSSDGKYLTRNEQGTWTMCQINN